jgi:adenosylcobinamide kinase/adenosylcobinamide-phosphate guanylyltransferase
MIELISGGAASGKSEFAEQEVLSLNKDRYYLATMDGTDPSGADRIRKHRDRRSGMGFVTIERSVDISGIKEDTEGSVILLEDLTNLAANEFFPKDAPLPPGDVPLLFDLAQKTADRILGDFDALYERCEDIIVVTQDVFRDCQYNTYTDTVKAYIRLLSLLNIGIGRRSDRIFEVVYSAKKRIR